MSSDPSNVPALDENLREALSSPRDRLTVVRLEQDIISFLSDTSRDVLEVPSLNGFQRLLAHKTGDFYQLTHVSDSTQQLILFHKHPWSKVPQRKLCDMSINKNNPKKVKDRSSTVQGQPRQVKIMKRMVEANTSQPKQPPVPLAQSAAEVKEKDKLEKEERYRAARARIFQGVEEAQLANGLGDKSSRARSRNNSRSHSREPRSRPIRQVDGDYGEFNRRVSEPYFQESEPHSDNGDLVHTRHQQYFQNNSPAAEAYQRPPVESNKAYPGVWNPKSTTPLSMANLATLEAQTSKQPVSPALQRHTSPAIGHSPASGKRSLAPPVNASGNLWAPPVKTAALSARNASALGLNLSASPWTPKQPTTVAPKSATSQVTQQLHEQHEDDPTHILRELALDDKQC